MNSDSLIGCHNKYSGYKKTPKIFIVTKSNITASNTCMRYKEDFEYIDKIKAGNKHAFGFLVEKYKDMVYSITLKILKNPDDAKDVAQESYIKAFEKEDTFKL